MATFAEAVAEAHTHMDMDASKWTTRYIDTGEASTTFVQCVDDNGDLHIIEGIWRLIKAFMIMSDEHRDLCRQVAASPSRECVVVRDGVIVPFLYFTNIFNRRAGTELSLWNNPVWCTHRVHLQLFSDSCSKSGRERHDLRSRN